MEMKNEQLEKGVEQDAEADIEIPVEISNDEDGEYMTNSGADDDGIHESYEESDGKRAWICF